MAGTVTPPASEALQPGRIACPQSILTKVHQFDEQAEVYQSGDYSEAQLRIDFINPMLEALGWDVNNRQGHAEAYREVVYEDALKIGGASKAPDYGFYIGGRAAGGGRKFFLEAKRPSVAIGVRAEPAFQLRRYAYTAQLPLSILTNFKEFIVYDTRIKLGSRDSALTAAILTIKYTEYPQRWDEIASVFSREAILRGAFDKFAQGKRKKGVEPLGDAFLRDIEAWRDHLAREIAAKNDLSVADLNFAVQRTIDRILFLRICEDRGIEPVGNLMQLLSGDKVYERLGAIFRGADDRYNSGIFHFPAAGRRPDPDRTELPDDLTLGLTIGDAAIRPIIRGLYDAPGLFTSYAFAVIPPEILGQVYERFLGKVITIPAEHRVRIEEKPEVRKAGGVYYTPTYIVNYIVRNTVGTRLDGKSPKDAEKLRILDPASGSGSFLIGAYQFLLDWHLRWYLDHDPDEHCKGRNPPLMRIHAPSFAEEPGEPALKRDGPRDYRLTTQKRKEILLNCIYGVDIDPQAVEVTKLSLLLKVLEGESQESVNAQLKFLHQRALPDLGRNIQCGNSLIGDDFDDSEVSDDERRKINKLNWQRAFPAIFKAGGFDAVIGNPPYVLLQDEFRDERQLAYFRAHYEGASYKLDTYHLFVEKSANLIREGGYASMIIPANFLTNNHLVSLRRLLLTKARLDHIAIVDHGVFAKVSVDSAIYVLERRRSGTKSLVMIHATPKAGGLDLVSKRSVSRSDIESSEHLLFTVTGAYNGGSLWTLAARHSVRLGELAHVNFGKQLRDRRKHLKDVITIQTVREAKPPYRPCYTGRDIDRYWLTWSGLACLDDPRARRGGCWDSQMQNARQKLITRQIGRSPRFALDHAGHQCLNTVFMVNPKTPQTDPRFLLGILNSRLMAALWLSRFYDQRRTFPKIKGTYLKELPIRTIESTNTADNAAKDRMVKLVDRMLDLHKRLAAAKSPPEKERLQRDIESTDGQIDQLVYELYGLTEAEIRIVHEATAHPRDPGKETGRKTGEEPGPPLLYQKDS